MAIVKSRNGSWETEKGVSACGVPSPGGGRGGSCGRVGGWGALIHLPGTPPGPMTSSPLCQGPGRMRRNRTQIIYQERPLPHFGLGEPVCDKISLLHRVSTFQSASTESSIRVRLQSPPKNTDQSSASPTRVSSPPRPGVLWAHTHRDAEIHPHPILSCYRPRALPATRAGSYRDPTGEATFIE